MDMAEMVSNYVAVMNPGGGLPFGVWIVIVIALVVVGGSIAFFRSGRK